MAKRSPARRAASTRSARKPARSRGRKTRRGGASARKAGPRVAKRAKRSTQRAKASVRRTTRARRPKRAHRPAAPGYPPGKTPHLDRVRRTLDDDVVPTPPSSLNMDRHGSAARTGRAEIREGLEEHPGISPAITGGDVDANWEQAYFAGDEAPGGDNPTPDQDVVEDIGKALGVQYDDNEELKPADKLSERDRHRWELDPASSEDYKDRK